MNRSPHLPVALAALAALTLGLGACMSGAPAAPAAPAARTMQAIVQTGNGGPEVLALQTVAVPTPAAGQVLIKVYAAAVNPVDWKMRQGMGGRGGPPAGAGTGAPEGMGAAAGMDAPAPASAGPSRSIPGMDIAGVIDSVGAGVTAFKPGDKVLSMIGRSIQGFNGGYAEYTLAPVENVVAKPANLSYAEAAGIGTVALAAMRMVSTANIAAGQRVFVNGIAGGVGSTAAQIAKARGAWVVGTASARHNDYLKRIGVDEVVDYTQVKFEDKIKDVDVVMDTIGGDTAERALKTLKKGGIYATVAGRVSAETCAAAGVTCGASGPPGAGGPSEGSLVGEVAALAAAGKVAVNIDKTFPLAEAAAAQEENRSGHTQGKIVLAVVAAQVNQK